MAATHFKVICEGKIAGLFSGFSEGGDFSSYEVFQFDNGQKWQQDEPYYYYYGFISEPYARVIAYGDNHYILVDALPEDHNPILPRPVKVVNVS